MYAVGRSGGAEMAPARGSSRRRRAAAPADGPASDMRPLLSSSPSGVRRPAGRGRSDAGRVGPPAAILIGGLKRAPQGCGAELSLSGCGTVALSLWMQDWKGLKIAIEWANNKGLDNAGTRGVFGTSTGGERSSALPSLFFFKESLDDAHLLFRGEGSQRHIHR